MTGDESRFRGKIALVQMTTLLSVLIAANSIHVGLSPASRCWTAAEQLFTLRAGGSCRRRDAFTHTVSNRINTLLVVQTKCSDSITDMPYC